MPALLSNASATGSAVQWPGGGGIFTVDGTFGGATVTLQMLAGAGNYVAVPGCAFTSASMARCSLPPGTIRVAVSGGAPSGLYSSLDQLRDGAAIGFSDGAASSGLSANGIRNEDAVATSGDAGVFVLGVRQDARTSSVSADGDYSALILDGAGRLKVALANSAGDWSANGTITNTTTAVTIKASAGAGIRNRVIGLQLSHAVLGAATVLQIRDGAAGPVVWQGLLDTAAMQPTQVNLGLGAVGSNATLLEIVTLTAVTGAVYYDVQGDVSTS